MDFPQYLNDSYVASLEREEQLEVLETILNANDWSDVERELVTFQVFFAV